MDIEPKAIGLNFLKGCNLSRFLSKESFNK